MVSTEKLVVNEISQLTNNGQQGWYAIDIPTT